MIACVLIPHFRIALELQRRPELRGIPVVIASGARLSDTVVDCSKEAAAEGIRRGMSLHAVTALCREVVLLANDPVEYRKRMTMVLAALEEVSPIVEGEEHGCAFLDLRGLQQLYRTADSLHQRIRRQVQQVMAVEPQVGIATGRFPAKMAALHAPRDGYRIVRPQEAKEFLAPLPVDVLPVAEAMIARLHRLGLQRLEQIAALPMSAVQAQFGPDGRRAWQLCNGKDDARLLQREAQSLYAERLTFETPVTSWETLDIAVRELIARFFLRPKHENMLAEQVQLRLIAETGQSWECVWTPREVLRSQDRLAFFVSSKLALAELPGPVMEMVLELRAATHEAAQQGKLFMDTAHLQQQVRAAVRRLVAQYGSSPIQRIVEVEPWSRIPERRWALIAYEP